VSIVNFNYYFGLSTCLT